MKIRPYVLGRLRGRRKRKFMQNNTNKNTKKAAPCGAVPKTKLKSNKSPMFCQVQIILKVKKSIRCFSQFPSQCLFGRKKVDLFTFPVDQLTKIVKIAVSRKHYNRINLFQIYKYISRYLDIKISFFNFIAIFINNNFYRFGNDSKTNFLELSYKLLHFSIIRSNTDIVAIFQNLILFFKKALYFNPIQPKAGFLLRKVSIGTIDENNYFRLHFFSITQVQQLFNEGSGVRFGPVTGTP